jgi:hypothetical protein
MAVVEITLGADPSTGEGGVTVPVYPQRHAYLTNRLGKFLNELVESGQSLAIDNLLDVAGAQAYALLTALIPNLSRRLPEWEFMGYPTRDAMEAGEYDPAADEGSPSVPEIRTAIKVASDVNGLDILMHIKGLFGLVDPTLLRSIVSEQLLDLIDSTTSPSSQSATGGSASTSSGTTAPISTENEDSPSLASAA